MKFNNKPIKAGDFVRYDDGGELPQYGIVVWANSEELGVEVAKYNEPPTVIKKKILDVIKIGSNLKS